MSGSLRLRMLASSCATALLLTTGFASAQGIEVLSDDQLYLNARTAVAGGRKEYRAAMAYMYAYIQRNTAAMQQNTRHRTQVFEFYSWVRDATAPTAAAQSGSVYGTYSTPHPPELDPRPPAWTATPPLASGEAVTLSPPPPVNVAQFPLVCRGGREFVFFYAQRSSLSDQPHLSMTFERGTSAGRPSSGQCTWRDRALSPNEPNVLLLVPPVFRASELAIVWGRGDVPSSSMALDYINALQRENELRTFHVYNNGRGQFVVTRIE